MNVECRVCGGFSAKPFLVGRPDYEYGGKAQLNYLQCENQSCLLVYVSPLPDESKIGEFYSQYTTHQSNTHLSAMHLLSRWNVFKYTNWMQKVVADSNKADFRILDFGCGNGNFMLQLRKVIIGEVIGYDIDSAACRYASSEGFLVVSDINKIPEYGPYDCIFLNHVIEHLYNLEDMSLLARQLKSGGKLVIRTPNTGSFLCNIFGSSWRAWETPRHLNIFNKKSIRILAERLPDMFVTELTTSNLMFSGVFNGSFHSTFMIRTFLGKLARKVLLFLVYPIAIIFNVNGKTGEELVLVALKR